MAKFKHERMSLEGSAFRLLRLLKGDSDSIQCELLETRLPPPKDVGDYAALSYVWGSGSRPCEITINGSGLDVTKNAYLALRDLRYPDKDRLLWIDALCIDQNNTEERGHQVQQMGAIYSKAERVFVWLGEPTYDTDYIMSHIKQLEKDLEREVINHGSEGSEIPDERLKEIWSALISSLSNAQKGLLVEGLQSLLHRNWFKRVWIIQEAANAQVAEIICGGKSVSASIFARMPFLLGFTPDPHCESILSIMPGPLRDRSWWVGKPDLRTMLDKFRNSEATEPRDHIYALLGISSNTRDIGFLKADYEKELEDLCFDTTSFFLDFHKLDSPPCRFFDWGIPEFLTNLNSLANEVFKCAIRTNYVALVEELVVRDDVDVNLEVIDDQTPLVLAAKNGYAAIVKLLLETGKVDADFYYNGHTPLSWAAALGHIDVVKLLLETGKVDADSNYNGRTPLSWATRLGYTDVVKLLLETGKVDADHYDDGDTPLSLAAKLGYTDIVKLLLETGKVDADSKDLYRQTPMGCAAARGHTEIVKLLLETGKVDIGSQDINGETPLLLALKNNRAATAEPLVEAGA